MQLNLYLTLYIKIQNGSDPNVRAKTIKLLGGNG